MKRAFSLLETIIVLLVIAIISSVAIYQNFFTLEKANIVQLKTEVALIQNGINRAYEKRQLLQEMAVFPSSLDDSMSNQVNEKLFENVLEYPVFATTSSEQLLGKWIKESNNEYSVVISSSELLSFVYDKSDGTFKCDSSHNVCKELY